MRQLLRGRQAALTPQVHIPNNNTTLKVLFESNNITSTI